MKVQISIIFAGLFFRLKGGPEDEKWRSDPHFRNDKPLFNKIMNEAQATALINDANWTKFVFFRDPAERLLSAWLDKFANGNRYRSGGYARRRARGLEDPSVDVVFAQALRIFHEKHMNFSGFVEKIESDNRIRGRPEGLHLC